MFISSFDQFNSQNIFDLPSFKCNYKEWKKTTNDLIKFAFKEDNDSYYRNMMLINFNIVFKDNKLTFNVTNGHVLYTKVFYSKQNIYNVNSFEININAKDLYQTLKNIKQLREMYLVVNNNKLYLYSKLDNFFVIFDLVNDKYPDINLLHTQDIDFQIDIDKNILINELNKIKTLIKDNKKMSVGKNDLPHMYMEFKHDHLVLSKLIYNEHSDKILIGNLQVPYYSETISQDVLQQTYKNINHKYYISQRCINVDYLLNVVKTLKDIITLSISPNILIIENNDAKVIIAFVQLGYDYVDYAIGN